MYRTLFTSESVTCGHPDKICDQISDAILDAALSQDPASRVAVECAVKNGLIFIFGELSTKGYIDFPGVARRVVRDIGYTRAKYGFDAETCGIISSISEQSTEIAHAVIEGQEIGAGDQGMMFGFACRETPEYMPLPIMLAHKLAKQLADTRQNGQFLELRPDGKTQVTVEYSDGKPVRAHTVVISAQHDPQISQKDLAMKLQELIVQPILSEWIDAKTIFHFNPSGSFVKGGPQSDAGLTGRKIIVDSYGGYAPHGGGAFSGKDPSKVDRSGAYVARYIAKNIVAAGLAEKCQIELSYAIGIAEPLAILVETFGTEQVAPEKLQEIIVQHFPLKPGEIIDALELRQPIYEKTATYGHFGRDIFPWERLDKVELLRNFLS